MNVPIKGIYSVKLIFKILQKAEEPVLLHICVLSIDMVLKQHTSKKLNTIYIIEIPLARARPFVIYYAVSDIFRV